jgi:hypothetical protein
MQAFDSLLAVRCELSAVCIQDCTISNLNERRLKYTASIMHSNEMSQCASWQFRKIIVAAFSLSYIDICPNKISRVVE